MNSSYKQLNIEDRHKIERWLSAKVPVREMARVLKRPKATLYRELKRNYFVDESLPKYAGYYGAAAQLQADGRRARQHKLNKHPDIAKDVVQRLKNGWTPEQIGNRMIHERAPLHLFPGRHGAGALVASAGTPQVPQTAAGQKAPAPKIRP